MASSTQGHNLGDRYQYSLTPNPLSLIPLLLSATTVIALCLHPGRTQLSLPLISHSITAPVTLFTINPSHHFLPKINERTDNTRTSIHHSTSIIIHPCISQASLLISFSSFLSFIPIFFLCIRPWETFSTIIPRIFRLWYSAESYIHWLISNNFLKLGAFLFVCLFVYLNATAPNLSHLQRQEQLWSIWGIKHILCLNKQMSGFQAGVWCDPYCLHNTYFCLTSHWISQWGFVTAGNSLHDCFHSCIFIFVFFTSFFLTSFILCSSLSFSHI